MRSPLLTLLILLLTTGLLMSDVEAGVMPSPAGHPLDQTNACSADVLCSLLVADSERDSSVVQGDENGTGMSAVATSLGSAPTYFVVLMRCELSKPICVGFCDVEGCTSYPPPLPPELLKIPIV